MTTIMPTNKATANPDKITYIRATITLPPDPEVEYDALIAQNTTRMR